MEDETGEDAVAEGLDELRDDAASNPVEEASDEDAKKVNMEWEKMAKELTKPYKVQNLTLEPCHHALWRTC